MADSDRGLDDYRPPDVRHYFTRRTRVSLELTFDWEEDEEAADDNTAVYVWADDDDENVDGGEGVAGDQPRPRIAVALYPAPPGSVDAALRIGEKVVAQLGGSPPPSEASDGGAVEEIEADGFRGERRTFACQLPQGQEARVRLTLFQVGDFVASLLAILPVWRGDIEPLIASFDAAVASVRFIPLSA